jgi:hypothetical protein
MPSSGIRTDRENLADRLANVLQASRTIRAELELTICESSETRLKSQRLRRTAAGRPASPRKIEMRQTPSIGAVAESIARILSNRGYSAFVLAPPRDTALIQ